MAKRGNPNISALGKLHAFKKGSTKAKEASRKGLEARKKKASLFANVRPMVDFAMPASKITDKMAEFWESRNIPRDKITPVLADITPSFVEALNNRDWPTIHDIYKFLGLSFESTRDQNIKVAFENELETKTEISGEMVIQFVEQKPEPIES